jgi:hypothetical protein
MIEMGKVLLSLFTIFLIGTACASVDLVKGGKATSEIVIAGDAGIGVKLAADDLQKHLELISGAKLMIVNAPSPEVKNQVYVGTSEFTDKLGFKLGAFNNSGFAIVAKDNYVILAGVDKIREASPYKMNAEDNLYLFGGKPKSNNFPSDGLKKWQDFCGEKFTNSHATGGAGSFNGPLKIHSNDDTGTWYAVSELLEQLGVRWYMPYENGTVIPEKKTISIPDQSLKKEAKFARREFCYYGTMRSDGDGISWFKRLKLGNFNTIIFNHTTYDIYSSKEQQELHPEYLACDKNGKPYSGYPSGRGMPRYTNPEFRKAAVIYMNKVFEAFPDLSAITIGPPDGGVKMDARDLDLYGKPGDSEAQKASNYVWDFHVFLARELKKSHPDKFLLYMSGAGAAELPSNIEEWPDNLIRTLDGSSVGMVINSTNKAVLAQRQLWFDKMKKVNKAPLWDYFLYYRDQSHPRYPVIFTESLQSTIREIQPYCDGKFIEIQPENFINASGKKDSKLGVAGLIHLMVYWQSKLFWDPDMDRKKILDEYYELFFGPAKVEMKEFHEYAEAVWNRQESRSITQSTGFLKEKDVDRFFELLSQARAKAGKDSVYDKRIAQMETEMQPLKKLFPNLKRTGPSFQAYPTPEKFTLDGDLGKYAYGKAILRDNETGEIPQKNSTTAILAITPDKSALIIGAICNESNMGKLKADCKLNDKFEIFSEDVLEVYINTPERSFFKIVVNPNGAVWDQCTDVSIVERDTLPILWNPGIKAVVKKFDDRWTVEIMIPSKDFGNIGPTKEFPWGIQVGRTRFTGGKMECWAIAPTNGAYATLNKWGDLWMR